MKELMFDEFIDKMETKKAYQLMVGGKKIWLPKSQCGDIDHHKHAIMVEDWLIEKQGLEAYCFRQGGPE